MVNFLPAQEAEALQTIAELARRQSLKLWIVGGVLRDALLGASKRLADIDLVVEGSAEILAEVVARHFKGRSKVFPEFLTAKVLGIPGIDELDFASTRVETYSHPGALPLVQVGSLQQDALRRDFSVNALYVELNNFLEAANLSWRAQVVDSVGGLIDLDARLIRILHPKSFLDDPSRMFRAIRYKAKIAGQLESQTEHLLQQAFNSQALHSISKQRVLMELRHACAEDSWTSILGDFNQAGFLEQTQLCFDGQASNLQTLLARSTAVLEPAERFDYLLGLLYFLAPEQLREDHARSMGLGKKLLTRMKRVRQPSALENPDAITEALREIL